MKKISIIFSVLTISIAVFSCKTNKVVKETAEAETTEVWENGISLVSGIISEVRQEKDGQTIKFTNNKGIHYVAVVSIPNLGENHGQYRKFEVGESVMFKGETLSMGDETRVVVREILETR